jgi:hypothetical protein
MGEAEGSLMIPCVFTAINILGRKLKYLLCKELQKKSQFIRNCSNDGTGRKLSFCVKFFHLCIINIDCADDSACCNDVIIIGHTHSVEVTLYLCVQK